MRCVELVLCFEELAALTLLSPEGCAFISTVEAADVKHGLKRNDPVEHSIRNAINTAYEDQLKQPGCNSMDLFPKKPTNKQFIIYAADEVFKKMCVNKLDSLS